MIERAQYWVDMGYVYSPNAPTTYTWSPDAAGHNYRNDCSGLVSNAWHMNTSYDTKGFFDHLNVSGYWHSIAMNDLQPGDAILQTGHIELFAKWKSQSDHAQGAYVYSFNRASETVENPYANSNFGYLGFDSWSDLNTYTPIRYDNVSDDVSGGGATSGGTAVMGDLGLLSTPANVIAIHRKGSDNGVWGVSQVGEGGMYGAWTKIGTQTTASNPATLTATSSAIVSFVRGTDNKIYGVSQLAPGGAYGAWSQVGTGQPAVASSPAILRSSAGLLVAIARGTDNKVYGVSQVAVGGAYGSWGLVGSGQPTFIGDVSAFVAPNDGITVVGRGTDGYVWGVSQSGPNGAYGTWSHIGS